jgi:hypothetical protein
MREYATDLKMPKGYVDMSLRDMEYDGSFSWKTLTGALVVAGIAATMGGAVVGVFSSGAAATVGGYVAGAGLTTAIGAGTAHALISKHES